MGHWSGSRQHIDLLPNGLVPTPASVQGGACPVRNSRRPAPAARTNARSAVLGGSHISATVRRDRRSAENRQLLSDHHLGVSDDQNVAGNDPCTNRFV